MNGKTKALIFDTNFIIENEKNLRIITEKLLMKYVVFISDVSIKEILSQKYLELKKYYEKANDLQKKIDIEIRKSFVEQYEQEANKINEFYLRQFGGRIIPSNTNEKTLQTVLDRLYIKAPPFIDEEKASDKGFKDTLIWLSILDYFKGNIAQSKQINSIVFLTNDNIFHKYSAVLQKEFLSTTGFIIEIIRNNDYKQFLDDEKILTESAKESVEVNNNKLPPHTIEKLRKDIYEVITKLCYETEDVLFGGPYFIIHEIIEGDFVESAFMEMERTYNEHMFETEISPNIIFGDWSFLEAIHNIPIENVERAIELYRTIKNDYKEYLIQFYNAAAAIFNENYKD